MSSKTRILGLVRNLRWKELRSDLSEAPEFLGFRDEKGRNLLHLCCSVNLETRGMTTADSLRTADVLIDAGIDINAPAVTQGDWKATPLWYAIAFGNNVALARHLIKRGSSPRYCLWAAVNRDNAAAIRLLLQSGADDPTNEEGSPLLAAIDWKKPKAAAELLKLGADVNYQDKQGVTPLHAALNKRRDVRLVRMLVKHGARGDIKDGAGATAADLMMRRRDPEFRRLAAQLATRS
jgi:ankyrin repeat protein